MEDTVIFVYLIASLVSFVILYFLIKGAVKNGMIEANQAIKYAKHLELNDKYEKGVISSEEYKSQVHKL